MALVDTHVHFDGFVEDGSLAEVLDRAAAAGVERMIAVGGSPAANRLALELAGRHPKRIAAAIGLDRDRAEEAVDFAGLRQQAGSAVAIGETGLDYYYTPETAAAQRRLFARCLDLALELRKPVIVHTRDADADTLAALRGFCAQWKGDAACPGVVHCFTRDRAVASQLLDLGFYISFSGIVTFTGAEALRQTAAQVPLDRLLIETDSPYLAPVPYRGGRCEPSLLPATAGRLAGVLGVSIDELARRTAANAAILFGLDDRPLSPTEIE